MIQLTNGDWVCVSDITMIQLINADVLFWTSTGYAIKISFTDAATAKQFRDDNAPVISAKQNPKP